jgi:hypothetical protein
MPFGFDPIVGDTTPNKESDDGGAEDRHADNDKPLDAVLNNIPCGDLGCALARGAF